MFPEISKRTLFTVGAAGLAAAALPGARRAAAQQTPRNALVIAAQIDDLVALDRAGSLDTLLFS